MRRTILDRGVASGVQKHTLESLVNHLASANLTPDQGRIILEPLFRDAQTGHSTRHVFLKIHECFLKKVRSDTLNSMAQNRNEAFKNARALLAGTGYGSSTGTDPVLLNTTAFALESGQDPSSLQDVLIAGKGKSINQTAAVIEASEILHYIGLEPEILVSIMKDCLRKNLDSQQIRRVTEHVMEKLKAGGDHNAIREELWIQAI